MSGTDLSFTNLSGADLTLANLTRANLSFTKLRGAKYSAKTIFPPNFDPKAAGMVLTADQPTKGG